MTIVNKSDHIKGLKEGDTYTLDFGNIARNTRAEATVEIQGTNVSNFKASVTCGCTEADVDVIDSNTVSVKARYKNTHLISSFNKAVILNFKENGQAHKITIKLKGVVR